MDTPTTIVTGGAGFIGSAVVRALLRDPENKVVNVDSLTYAANPASLAEADTSPQHTFEKIDVIDRLELQTVF